MGSKVKLGGFMCRSPASTAVVCVPDDARSVIVPRRRAGRRDNNVLPLGERSVKYSRLGETEKKRREQNFLLLGERNFDHRPQQKPRALQRSVPASADVFQVVVLRVSIHCQGCAGKVKKHLSRMEGVTSFSIDLDTKRVTIMGHISPAGVLESVSKVKRAEFWPC